jgi:hypothetical protein
MPLSLKLLAATSGIYTAETIFLTSLSCQNKLLQVMPSANTLSSSQQGQGRNAQLFQNFLIQLRELSSGQGFQNAIPG